MLTLFIGYTAVFVLLLGYVLRLGGRIARLEAEIQRLGSSKDGGTAG